MRAPLVVPPNPITPEEYARKLGISRKRFLELKAITDKVLADNAHKYLDTGSLSVQEASPNGTKRKTRKI